MPEKIIIARGEVSKKDLELGLLFLGKLELSTEVVDLAALEELRTELMVDQAELPYGIDEISRPDQFLVKEHFEQFRSQYTGDISSKYASRVFGFLVKSQYVRDERSWDGPSQMAPSDFGLEIIPRSEAGFPDIRTTNSGAEVNSYAVQVGSLLRTVDSWGNGRWDDVYGFGERSEYFIRRLHQYLRPRLEQ